MKDKPLLNKSLLLEKFTGKGGWTYARVPEIPQDKNAPFGWRKVKGTIDNFEIKQFKLMPFGNGQLFLPVKAAIRKKIGKEAGDWINVILYTDDSPIEIPEEFAICLQDEPEAWKNFQGFTESEQSKYINWIYSIKTEDLKVERMAQAINKISKDEKI